MSRSTNLGQRYHVVQVAKYRQHRKVPEMGAELAVLETDDADTVTADKLAAPESVFSATAPNCHFQGEKRDTYKDGFLAPSDDYTEFLESQIFHINPVRFIFKIGSATYCVLFLCLWVDQKKRVTSSLITCFTAVGFLATFGPL